MAAPALVPPEVHVDQNLLNEYEAEMAAAANMELPDQEDDDL